ncbi:TOBE domain-containing protein [Campylobacter showae]|uniref:Molybdenum import ATP-binding protein ModC n=1 Tax=Campylobacter showae CC57C TaxID=1073353 RepID=M3IMR9_9BACT|nr:TOBE domain-containing protein [Campylobacter showae]EMG31456.1 molybdenum import ATP-binding protein ModC [Campylobacter showae CC57C]
MIKAKISAIEQTGGVSVFEFSVENLSLKMLSLENLQNLKIGDEVRLNFKSSDVFVATSPLLNCSVSNEIQVRISDIQKGEITSSLHLNAGEFEFESIISAASLKRLNLALGDQIYAYVKATSLYIA